MNMVEQVTDYVKNYDEEVGKAIELVWLNTCMITAK